MAVDVIGELSAIIDDGISPEKLNLKQHMSSQEWKKRIRGSGTEK